MRKEPARRAAEDKRSDWQVALCARGARAGSQGLCPPRLWRHEPQAKYNEEPPAKLVGYFFYAVRGVPRRMIAPPKCHTADGRRHACPGVSAGAACGHGVGGGRRSPFPPRILYKFIMFPHDKCPKNL